MMNDTELWVDTREDRTRVAVNSLVRSVYIWMGLALVMTGGTATLVAGSPQLLELFIANRLFFWGLLIAQFVLVFAISGKVNSWSLPTLSGMFMLYSVLTGITFSVYFLAFTAESIASTFFITAGTFMLMSAYGWMTKKDLTKFGNLLLMVLVGVIIATLVNLFIHSSLLNWLVSYVGVAVFVGLVAWDTQKVKSLAYFEDNEMTQKLAIAGALTLYLDFINLFVMLLRLFGDRNR